MANYNISSGMVKNGINLSSYDSMYISSGGIANDTSVYSYASMHIYSGGTANSTLTTGDVYVSSGGIASNTTVDYCGNMYVSRGGTAKNTTVEGYAEMNIYSGGSADTVNVYSSGRIHIHSGGSATNIIAESGAIVAITVAPNTYIQGNYAGSAFETKNGVVSNFTIDTECRMHISSGLAEKTTVCTHGAMLISEGGKAENTFVNYYGSMYISSGGAANYTSADNYGSIVVLNGGTAHNTSVENCSDISISSGGTANCTTINYRASMQIYSGGIHSGSLQIASGADVSADDGSIIDFTVAECKSSSNYLINNLEYIDGAPTYTITVCAEQEIGTYKLAQGAGNLTGSLSIGDGTVNYGSITINGDDFNYNNIIYSLDNVNGNLTLTLAKINNLQSTNTGVSWDTTPDISSCMVEYSTNNFGNSLPIVTNSNAVDTYGLSAGTYQWRVSDGENWYDGKDIVSDNSAVSQQLASDADGDTDLFFASVNGRWDKFYAAAHQGILNGWRGT